MRRHLPFRSVSQKATFNIIMLSLGLFFTFSSIKTITNAEKFIAFRVAEEDPQFAINTDLTLCVTYALLSVTFWFSPMIITHTGPRPWLLALCVASIMFSSVFLYPTIWLLYTFSAILGFLVAMSYTAHGYYITLNSTQHTIGRNSGIFWALLQSSMLVGNLFLFFVFQNKHLNLQTRRNLCYFMIAACTVGLICMCFIGRTVYSFHDNLRPLKSIVNLYKIWITRDMLLLSLTFMYNGIQNTFMNGVYSNIVAFTKSFFVEEKMTSLSIVFLTGVFIGAGNTVGGYILGFIGNNLYQDRHYPVIIFGCILHILCYILVLLNLPNDSVNGSTEDEAIMKSNIYLAMFCGFILGLGDACFNTQIYAIIARKYPQDSATAFSVCFFVTYASTAMAYAYNQLGLYVVIGCLICMTIIGSISFCYVELNPKLGLTRNLPESFDSLDLMTS